MPWTLKETSFVFALQASLLKQYVYLPSWWAVKEWSPDDTVRSWIWLAFEGLVICVFAVPLAIHLQLHPETENECTQKSMSRFPLPPNSLSPTWNVTVILSSTCSCS